MNTRTRTPDTRAGFSLAEMMIVLVLIGLMASLVTPSFRGFLGRQNAQRALDRVAGDVSLARMLAVQRGRPALLRLQPNGVYSVDTLTAAGDTVTVKRVDLRREHPELTFVNPDLRFVFSSRGLLTNASSEGVVVVTSGVGRDSLFVSPVGRVYRAF